MIWFGNLPGVVLPATLRFPEPGTEHGRMQKALEWVAAQAPHLRGTALIEALAETGWVDEATAARLLPHFRHFDADRCFAENLRRISFRGTQVAAEFRSCIARAAEDMLGSSMELGMAGPEEAIRFRCGEQEGILLAYPEVAFSIGGPTRAAITAAVEEMPDVLVLVARNFQRGTAEQLAGLLAGTEVPGTLLTVNLLLGMRAAALRFQPPAGRVLDLLGAGRPLRSADVAILGERPTFGTAIAA